LLEKIDTLRRDRAEPKLVNANMDRVLPIVTGERKDAELPKVAASTIDETLPICITPITDSVEPNLIALRTEHVDPREAASNAEIEFAQRLRDLSDMELAKLTVPNTDTNEPSCNAHIIESLSEDRTSVRVLRVDAIKTKLKIDNESPHCGVCRNETELPQHAKLSMLKF
jgi:hypothetical protein